MAYKFEVVAFKIGNLRDGIRRVDVDSSFQVDGEQFAHGIRMELHLRLGDNLTVSQIEEAAIVAAKDLLSSATKVLDSNTLQQLKQQTDNFWHRS